MVGVGDWLGTSRGGAVEREGGREGGREKEGCEGDATL